jgi:hypothetical protein
MREVGGEVGGDVVGHGFGGAGAVDLENADVVLVGGADGMFGE